MNDLQVFQNSEFGELAVLEIKGKPYFPATACARMLGYKRPADAISAHCKGSAKHRVLTNGGAQDLKIIPEGDLYRLIVHSKLPAAERFEKWVFDEVLPSIRQTGSYGQPDIAAIVAQTATAVCAEMTRQLVPLLQDLICYSERTESEKVEIVHHKRVFRRRTERGTSLWKLPPETQRRIRAMIRDGSNTYESIAKQLQQEGICTSRSSVCRYAHSANIFPDYNLDKDK